MSKSGVVVLGLGYVGLPAAMLLARSGVGVVGVDIDVSRVDQINAGSLRLDEPDLEALFSDPAVKANLRASVTPTTADTFIIAVPTPLDHRKKIADLSYVAAAAESLLPCLRHGSLVILESTVPPLTCRELLTPILERTGLRVGEDVLLAHCPERILPGNVMQEIIHNDRVIGGTTPAATERARALYSRFVQGKLCLTDDVSAEMVKLLENTYRDVNIALANEIAAVAETLGIDPIHVIDLANRHPRVRMLHPGIGVGGHCIPIDPWFIKEVDPANSRLIFAARLINDEQPARTASKIRRALRHVADPRIVAVGSTYKPNVLDERESPAAHVVAILREDGYHVEHYDPLVANMNYSSLSTIVAGADCLVVLVEHATVVDDLRANSASIRSAMRRPIIMRFFASPCAESAADAEAAQSAVLRKAHGSDYIAVAPLPAAARTTSMTRA